MESVEPAELMKLKTSMPIELQAYPHVESGLLIFPVEFRKFELCILE